VVEKARRERLLRNLESADKARPLELAKYNLKRAGASPSDTDIKNDIADCRFESKPVEPPVRPAICNANQPLVKFP